MTQYYFLIAGFLYGIYGLFQIKETTVPNPSLSGSGQTCLPYPTRRLVQTHRVYMNLEGGLMITELMYQPATGCPEYLEIANLDHRKTWWDSLRIQKNEGESILLPDMGEWPSGECRIFTEDRERLLECYQEVEPELVYEMDLFALNNDGATLNLMVSEPVIRSIDKVQYGPSDHNYFLRNTADVALERNIMAPRGNKWRSGFVQFGYRSPGFLPKWNMNLEFEVKFSTNTVYTRSGRKPSVLEIWIGSDRVDGSMTIEIFDLNGRKVHTLANAVPLQGGEEFTWKGRGFDGQMLPEGLYLFWIYYFDVSGQKNIVKRTCALSNK